MFFDACYYFMVQIHYEAKWEGAGPGNQDFFEPCEMASSRFSVLHVKLQNVKKLDLCIL
jgi:hypothetical protein